MARLIQRAGFQSEPDFVLRVVQPALVGMIDGTVSSLALRYLSPVRTGPAVATASGGNASLLSLSEDG